jgi:hypothetical protein
MSVACRRELMEIDAKLMEQPRNCSGISGGIGVLEPFHSENDGNTGLSRRNTESRCN